VEKSAFPLWNAVATAVMVARAVTPVESTPLSLTAFRRWLYNSKGEGRLAQWESACFTRKRSQVQALHRPPPQGAEVAERQTRCVQGAVPDRAWGFKSPLRHQTRALVAQSG
jgi:hypothetical protein